MSGRPFLSMKNDLCQLIHLVKGKINKRRKQQGTSISAISIDEINPPQNISIYLLFAYNLKFYIPLPSLLAKESIVFLQ